MYVIEWRIQEFSNIGQKPLEAQKYNGQGLGKAPFSRCTAGEKSSSEICVSQLPICRPLDTPLMSYEF